MSVCAWPHDFAFLPPALHRPLFFLLILCLFSAIVRVSVCINCTPFIARHRFPLLRSMAALAALAPRRAAFLVRNCVLRTVVASASTGPSSSSSATTDTPTGTPPAAVRHRPPPGTQRDGAADKTAPVAAGSGLLRTTGSVLGSSSAQRPAAASAHEARSPSDVRARLEDFYEHFGLTPPAVASETVAGDPTEDPLYS